MMCLLTVILQVGVIGGALEAAMQSPGAGAAGAYSPCLQCSPTAKCSTDPNRNPHCNVKCYRYAVILVLIQARSHAYPSRTYYNSPP